MAEHHCQSLQSPNHGSASKLSILDGLDALLSFEKKRSVVSGQTNPLFTHVLQKKITSLVFFMKGVCCDTVVDWPTPWWPVECVFSIHCLWDVYQQIDGHFRSSLLECITDQNKLKPVFVFFKKINALYTLCCKIKKIRQWKFHEVARLLGAWPRAPRQSIALVLWSIASE